MSPELTIVIGGAGGIGSEICRLYDSRQKSIVIVDKDTSRGDLLNDQLECSKSFIHADVTSRESIQNCVDQIGKLEMPVRHVISLAGQAFTEEFNGFRELEPHIIDRSVELNLTSHLHLIRALLPNLESTSGDRSIVLISSINAIKDYSLVPYSAAKAGLIGLTKSACGELGAVGIRINSILPGTVPTVHTEQQPKDFDEYLKGTSLGRFASTHEIAEVCFCLTEFMTCVTGQTIVADCGQSTVGYK